MKKIATIFAGGQGRRMHEQSQPKQFLEFRGKPIIIYTLELFQYHHEIDGIVIACLDSWISYLEKQVLKYHLTKVVDIVTGGETGQDSICNALHRVKQHYPEDSLVLIHDGVRPLVRESTISENIRIAQKYGSCVTCVPATETFVVMDEQGGVMVPERNHSLVARAPQTFILSEVLNAHYLAQKDGIHNFIDTCTMMNYYGYSFKTCIGSMENIKITTPADFFMFRAIQEAREEGMIFGL